jgi:hypothetical protein
MEAYKQTLRDLADPVSRMEAREKELKKKKDKVDYDVLPPTEVPKLFNPAAKKNKEDTMDYDALPPTQVPKLFNPVVKKEKQVIMDPDTFPSKPKNVPQVFILGTKKRHPRIRSSPSSHNPNPTLKTPNGVDLITDAERALFIAPRKPMPMSRDPQTYIVVHDGTEQPSTTTNLGMSCPYLHFNVTLIFSNILLISFIAVAPLTPTASTPNVSTEDSEMIRSPVEVPAEAAGMYRLFKCRSHRTPL